MYEFKNKELISKDNLLKYVSEYYIFKYYIGDFTIGRPFCSPLREDKNPSFNIGYNKVKDSYYYNDYLTGGGDVFDFIMNLYNFTFKEACNKIAIDLNLDKELELYNVGINICKNQKVFVKTTDKIDKHENLTYISAKVRAWYDYDFKYWGQFGIDVSTLNRYNVKPVSHSMINDKLFKLDKHAYSFVENKDDIRTITLYQPFSKDKKWFKNHDHSTWYGWSQLPTMDDILIITKSRKDIMSISENTDFSVTGLQNEKIKPKLHVIDELKFRFKTIILFYDNDYDKPTNWGRQFSLEISKEHDLLQIEIPDKYKSKDFTDLVQKYGVDKSVDILNKLIKDVIMTPSHIEDDCPF